jgi:hypothetical protein
MPLTAVQLLFFMLSGDEDEDDVDFDENPDLDDDETGIEPPTVSVMDFLPRAMRFVGIRTSGTKVDC